MRTATASPMIWSVMVTPGARLTATSAHDPTGRNSTSAVTSPGL